MKIVMFRQMNFCTFYSFFAIGRSTDNKKYSLLVKDPSFIPEMLIEVLYVQSSFNIVQLNYLIFY